MNSFSESKIKIVDYVKRDKRYTFRGFHPDDRGSITINLNGLKIKGDWYYWDEFGRAKTKDDKFIFGIEGIPKIEPTFVLAETISEWVAYDKNHKDIFLHDMVVFEDETPGNYEYHDSIAPRLGEVIFDTGEYYITDRIAVEMDDIIYDEHWDCEVLCNKWEYEEENINDEFNY